MKKYDLKKLKNFDKAYSGAEFYSLQDRNNPDFIDKIEKSDKWYDLLYKNSNGGLTEAEFIKFTILSLDLELENF